MDIKNLSVEERIALAVKGQQKDLEILIYDDAWQVRRAIAEEGRPEDLDILVNDESSLVRRAVAEQGRPEDLDVLVNDKSWFVRKVVAEHGRPEDLDVLKNDKDAFIRKEVKKLIEESAPSLVDEAKDMSKASDAQETPSNELGNEYVKPKIDMAFKDSETSEPTIDTEAIEMKRAKLVQEAETGSSAKYVMVDLEKLYDKYAQDNTKCGQIKLSKDFIYLQAYNKLGFDDENSTPKEYMLLNYHGDSICFSYDLCEIEGIYADAVYLKGFAGIDPEVGAGFVLSPEEFKIATGRGNGGGGPDDRGATIPKIEAKRSRPKALRSFDDFDIRMPAFKISLDAEVKDMSKAADAHDIPAAGHDKDKGAI